MRRPQVTQEAAERPIRRHGGDLPAKQIRELYALLRQMKEDCTFHPLPFALVLDGAWGAETPGRLRSPLEENDFLPLGRLGLGEHRVLLEGPGPIPRPCIGLIGGISTLWMGTRLDPGRAAGSCAFALKQWARSF